MAYKTILFDTKDGIATVTFNRPDKLNAMTVEMLQEISVAIASADADPNVRVIVIAAAGRAFCAGADLDAFKASIGQIPAQTALAPTIDDVQRDVAVALRQITKPVLVALNGPAVGIGLTFAIACDIRVASEKATLGAIFLRVGLTPEFGSSYNLVRLVGIAKACELVFTAKIIDAQESLRIGLVNQVVPHDHLMPATLEMARTVAALPPIAMRYAKGNLRNGADANLLAQVHQEVLANRICRDTEDYAEGVSAFLEKRKPVFKGR